MNSIPFYIRDLNLEVLETIFFGPRAKSSQEKMAGIYGEKVGKGLVWDRNISS